MTVAVAVAELPAESFTLNVMVYTRPSPLPSRSELSWAVLQVAADDNVVQCVSITVSVLRLIAGDLQDVDTVNVHRWVAVVTGAGDEVGNRYGFILVIRRPQRHVHVRNERDCRRGRIRRICDCPGRRIR